MTEMLRKQRQEIRFLLGGVSVAAALAAGLAVLDAQSLSADVSPARAVWGVGLALVGITAVGLPYWWRWGTPLALLGLLGLLIWLPPSPTSIGVGELAFGGVVALAGASWLVARPGQLGRWPAGRNGYAVPAMALVCGLALPMALAGGASLGDWLRATLPFLVLVVVFVAAAVVLDRPAHFAWCVHALVVVGLAFAGRTLYLFIANRQWAFSELGFYTRVTYLDPTTTVPAPLVGAVLALGLVLYEERLWRRLGYGVAAAGMAVAVAVTLSRGMVLGLVTGVGVLWLLLWLARARRQFIILTCGLAVGLLVVAIAAVALGYVDVIAARLSDTSLNDSVRLAEYLVALREFASSPVVGTGLGTSFYVPVYGALGLESDVNSIHNVALYFAAKTGLVGIGLVTLWFTIAGRETAAVLRSPVAQPWRLWVLVSAAAVAGLVTYAMTFAVYRLFYYNVALGLLLALIAQARRLLTVAATPPA